MKAIYLTILFCSFSILSVGVYSLQKDFSEEQTEATALLNKDKLDFCCDRDKTDESAQDMSEQEAQQIATAILSPDSYPAIKFRPKGSGQR